MVTAGGPPVVIPRRPTTGAITTGDNHNMEVSAVRRSRFSQGNVMQYGGGRSEIRRENGAKYDGEGFGTKYDDGISYATRERRELERGHVAKHDWS